LQKIRFRGILIGDKNSLINFYNISNSLFLRFLQENKRLVWEVNYWAWLESLQIISIIWYKADHDDSIVDIPDFLFIV